MGGKLVSLLVVFSLALNGAFVAGWVTHTVPALLAPASGADDCCPLYQKLGTSEAQWQQLEPRLAAFRQSAQGICREIDRQQRELLDLIAAPETDRAAVRAKQEAIRDGQRRIQDLVVEHLLAEKALLTPSQQKALFDLIRTRCGCVEPEPRAAGDDQELGDALRDCSGESTK
jgi:Spy/CpxP family protein refolding chaperone